MRRRFIHRRGAIRPLKIRRRVLEVDIVRHMPGANLPSAARPSVAPPLTEGVRAIRRRPHYVSYGATRDHRELFVKGCHYNRKADEKRLRRASSCRRFRFVSTDSRTPLHLSPNSRKQRYVTGESSCRSRTGSNRR
jgi:hypothetical protein